MREKQNVLLSHKVDAFIESHQKAIFTALDFFTVGFGTLCALKFFAGFPDGMQASVAGGAAAGSAILKQAIIEHRTSLPR